MRSSLAIVPALAAVAYAQGTALAATTSTTALPVGNCNACFFIADVAQVIFADFTQTATATNVVSATSGRNGTVFTSTFLQPAQPFSFGSGGVLSGTAVGASFVPIDGSTLVLSGVTLTSPTAYNVFTGYTSFTQVNSNGQCVTSTGASNALTNPFKFTITPGVSSELLAAESAFIANIGGASCMVIGVAETTTVPIQTTVTTVTSSATSLFRPSLLPESSSSSTVAASTTSALPASATNTTSGTSTSIVILTPSPTIVLGAGSTFHPRVIPASLVAALLVIPGIAAWLL